MPPADRPPLAANLLSQDSMLNPFSDRRKKPRIDVGRINHEAYAKVLGITTPWDQLTLRQRAAYASAAQAVIEAYIDADYPPTVPAHLSE